MRTSARACVSCAPLYVYCLRTFACFLRTSPRTAPLIARPDLPAAAARPLQGSPFSKDEISRMKEHGFDNDKNDYVVFDEKGDRRLPREEEAKLLLRLVATLKQDRKLERPRSVKVLLRIFE